MVGCSEAAVRIVVGVGWGAASVLDIMGCSGVATTTVVAAEGDGAAVVDRTGGVATGCD
jgi:hypothetical protein